MKSSEKCIPESEKWRGDKSGGRKSTHGIGTGRGMGTTEIFLAIRSSARILIFLLTIEV